MTDDPGVEPATVRAGRWALGVRRLQVDPRLADAPAYNLAGRRLTGPQQGFGWLWQRSYRARLGHGSSPAEVIEHWRTHFGELWPRGATFFGAPLGPLDAGTVSPIGVPTGTGLTLQTGVLVLYADDESFTFMTPEGHMFAGWITFSAATGPSGTVASVDLLVRPNDPAYQLAWPVMRRMEDRFWARTLRALGRSLGAGEVVVVENSSCVDRTVLWRNWRNIWFNAGIRTVLHLAADTGRWVRVTLRRLR